METKILNREESEACCETCGRKKDWDILEELLKRDERSKINLRHLSWRNAQLERDLQSMGQENQQGRIQHTNLQTHLLQFQQDFAESNRARAKIENDLIEERQARLHAERIQLASTRAQHDVEEQLDRVWKTTAKVGELLTIVCNNLDSTPVNMDKSHFNISKLLLENEEKEAKIQKLETEMGELDSAGWERKLED